MGRGLSDLQKTILTLAYEAHEPRRAAAIQEYERRKANNSPFNFDPLGKFTGVGFGEDNPAFVNGYRHWHSVTSQEVYHFHYGYPWHSYRWQGQPMFVEETPPSTVKVSVSKAFKRLAERGLIGKHSRPDLGWFLSPAGIEMAKGLMANSHAHVSAG